MSRTPFSTILLAGLALTAGAHAAPPVPDFTDLPAYITALNTSQDPQAVAIRREIADGPAALARQRAAAQAVGIPLEAAQVQRPLPPPEQNAAPLYQQLDALRHAKPLDLPKYAQPLGGTYAYTPAQLAAVQAVFDSRRDVLALLHQAAEKPQCVFAKNWSAGAGILFPELAGLREDARELKTESYLLAHQGRYEEAVTTQALGFGVARHAASDPTLINNLVAVAIDAITLEGLKGILYQAGPNAKVDAQVRQAVAAHPSTLSLKYALGGEVVMMTTTMGPLDDVNPSLLAGGFGLGPAKTHPLTPEEGRFVLNLLCAWEARYLSQMRPLIAAADAPLETRRTVFAAQPDATSPEQKLDPVAALNSILTPSNFSQVDQKDTLVQAQEQVVMAAAAILAVKAKTGEFPAALLGDFPDAFTGKFLSYRREGANGFVVYSVGVDGTFDGGKLGDYQFTPTQAFFRYPGPTLKPVPPDMLNYGRDQSHPETPADAPYPDLTRRTCRLGTQGAGRAAGLHRPARLHRGPEQVPGPAGRRHPTGDR